jgi:tetratricopeptide (TPR) repeat protein
LKESADDYIYEGDKYASKALRNALSALNLYELTQTANCVAIADCVVTLAGGYNGMDDHANELNNLIRAKSLYTSLNLGDCTNVAECLKSLGGAHYWNFEFEPMIEHSHQALDMYRRMGMGQSQEAADCLKDIGIGYFEMSDFETELKYLLEAYNIYKALGEPCANMADCLKRLAVSYLAAEDYDNYLEFALKSLSGMERCVSALKDGDEQVASALREVGNAYGWKDQVEKQIEYLNRAAEKYRHAGFFEDAVKCFEEICTVYVFLENKPMNVHFRKEADTMRKLIKQSDSDQTTARQHNAARQRNSSSRIKVSHK